MYKIFIDKNEMFEANIQIDGADPTNSICRLVLEHANYNILFEGKIKDNVVKIPIASLKQILKEGDSGRIKLEVVVDDTFFTPWSEEYEAKLSKKVTTEVLQTNEHKQLKPIVEITSIKNTTPISSEFVKYLTERFIKNKISFINVNAKINSIKSISEVARRKFNINKEDMLEGVTKALNNIEIT